ncbi:subtilisin sub10 [Cystoisospora suis]|uniref:subtilisin n=1 Tax=Cystoisospora suis TaxID=483139 RepID=A0A2C6KTW8_9APIC|nr:subtilisin sub10 [Cystoisospora suis]
MSGEGIDSSLRALPSSSSVRTLFSFLSLTSSIEGDGFILTAEAKEQKKKNPLGLSQTNEGDATDERERVETDKEEEEIDLLSDEKERNPSFSSSYLRAEKERAAEKEQQRKRKENRFSEDKLKMLEEHFHHIMEEFNSLSSSPPPSSLPEDDLFPAWEGEGRFTEEEEMQKKKKEKEIQEREEAFLMSLKSSMFSSSLHPPHFHDPSRSRFSSFDGKEKNLLHPFSTLKHPPLPVLQEESTREDDTPETDEEKRKKEEKEKEKEEEIEEKLERLIGGARHYPYYSYYKKRNENTCKYRAPLRQLFDEMQRLAMENALLERKASRSSSKSSSSSGSAFNSLPVKPEENLLIHWDRECLKRLHTHLKSLNSYQGLEEEEKDELEIFLLKEDLNFSPLHDTRHNSTLEESKINLSSSSSSPSNLKNALTKDEEEREGSPFFSSRKIDSSLDQDSPKRRAPPRGSYVVYRKGVFYTEFPSIFGERKEESSFREKDPQDSSSPSLNENTRENDGMTPSEQRGRSLALSILAGALGVRTPAKDIPLSSGAFHFSSTFNKPDKERNSKREVSPLDMKKEEEDSKKNENSNPEKRRSSSSTSSSLSSSLERRCDERCQRELERLLFQSNTKASMHATFYPLFDVDVIQIRHLPKIRKKLGLFNASSLLGFLSNAHEEKGFTVGTKFYETAKCILHLSFDKIGKTQHSLAQEDHEEESVREIRLGEKKADEERRKEEKLKDSSSGRRSEVAALNDPHYKKQWHHMHEISPFSLSSDFAWKALQPIQADDAAPVVALLDTGCVQHEDYYDSGTPQNSLLWRNKGETDCDNGTDEDNNGYVDDCWGWNFVDNSKDVFTDDSGHGTSLASLLVAKHNDGKGGVGVMPVGRVMCLKVGKGTSIYLSALIKALQYAIKQGAQISLLPHTFPQADSVLESVFKTMEEKNLDHLAVTAAGTSDCDLEDQNCLMYPASYKLESMIVVGSSKLSGGICCASNWGKETIDVYAPGNRVWGGTPVDPQKQNTQCKTCQGFTYGTSAAAGMVAGVASMIWMYFKKKQPEGWTAATQKESLKVKKALLYSSTPSPRLAGKRLGSITFSLSFFFFTLALSLLVNKGFFVSADIEVYRERRRKKEMEER